MEKLFQIPFYQYEMDLIANNNHHIEKVEDIVASITNICDFYRRRVFNISIVANRIFEINDLSQRLANGDITLINEVAKALKNNADTTPFTESQLVIATRFCSLYNPTAFPIFDPLVTRVMIEVANSDNPKEPIYLKSIKNDATVLHTLYQKVCDTLNLQLNSCKELFDHITITICNWIVNHINYVDFNCLIKMGITGVITIILSEVGINEPFIQDKFSDIIFTILEPFIQRLWKKINKRSRHID